MSVYHQPKFIKSCIEMAFRAMKHPIGIVKMSKDELGLDVADIISDKPLTPLQESTVTAIIRNNLEMRDCPRIGQYTREGGYDDVPAGKVKFQIDLL